MLIAVFLSMDSSYGDESGSNAADGTALERGSISSFSFYDREMEGVKI